MTGPVVRISSEKLEQAQKILAGIPGRTDRVVKEALYRAGNGLKTDAVSETKSKYHISASEIRKYLFFKKGGSVGYHSVTLSAQGPRKILTDYKVTGSKQNIKVAVKQNGMKTLRTGFLIMDRDGKKVVMWRPAGDSGPAMRVMSPSVPQLVKNKETMAEMQKQAQERFERRLDSNILRMLAGKLK